MAAGSQAKSGGGTNEVVGDVGQVEIVLFVIESDAIFGDRDPDLLFEIHRLLLLPAKKNRQTLANKY